VVRAREFRREIAFFNKLLAYEAADAGLLSPELAASIRRVRGVKKLGVRLGNWLTADEARRFWQTPDPETLKGKRDRAILAVLLGCVLRRRELADLDFTHLQQREEHWAIVDLIGKGGHIRTVPVPEWVRATLDEWIHAADLHTGKLFRCVCRAGKCWGDGVTERVVWHVVKLYAAKVGFARIAPHDLRRSCAKLCHSAGGELEQIQFLLGHVSVQTTERYLGCKQRIREAVNDQPRPGEARVIVCVIASPFLGRLMLRPGPKIAFRYTSVQGHRACLARTDSCCSTWIQTVTSVRTVWIGGVGVNGCERGKPGGEIPHAGRSSEN